MQESEAYRQAREYLNDNPKLMPKAVANHAATVFKTKADQDQFIARYFELQMKRDELNEAVKRWDN
jgi:ABC-type iron transport system FetAB ATPase subunit